MSQTFDISNYKSVRSNNLSLKYKTLTPYQVGKDIGIRKSEFVANTQLFFMLSLG